MSSCFLCDTSYNLTLDNGYYVTYAEGESQKYYMKQMPIIVGSSGTNVDDQQHENNKKQNYVSYRVKKIEFRSSIYETNEASLEAPSYKPNYILIFKVPFRNPVFDYRFTVMQNFMLYSEPESVLNYGVYKRRYDVLPGPGLNRKYLKLPEQFNLNVDKPFIVGPNDYVGVLYMFCMTCKISSSAKVWFDVV